MKNTMYATLTALLCTTALSAQAPAGSATAPGQMDTAKMEKGKMADAPMTVTGCVAQGADMDHFTLTNAMMSNMAKMDSGAAMKPDAAKPAMMTYELDGGTNLKAHLGHKVDVTGTMDKKAMMSHDTMAKPGAMGDKDKMGSMDKDKMGAAHKDMMAGKIKVTAVKMVSATCP